MTYEEWEAAIPGDIRDDTLWKMTSYRLGLFLSDLSWNDVTKLAKDRRTLLIADQSFRPVGNISSNIAEGYSRGTGKDRARFYEYPLGSAREARDWYYKGRHVLGTTVVEHRLSLCTQIIRLLLTTVSSERRANRRLQPNSNP